MSIEGDTYSGGDYSSEYSESFVEIPLDSLSPETLDAVIEDWVTRDGTDYGEFELTLEQKGEQLKAALATGEAKIIYEQNSETLRILAKGEIPS